MMNFIETNIAEIWMLLLVVATAVYILLESVLLYAALNGKLAVVRKFSANWDYSTTWAILAFGGLYATMPAWYAHLYSTAYISLIIFLIGNIFKGASLEFLHNSGSRWFMLAFQLGMGMIVFGVGGLLNEAIDMVLNVPHQGVADSQMFLLWGTLVFLPAIIGYGVYNYWSLLVKKV
ncbi:MAG: cytochrome d ubiquinol oxidase subunit II [Candidatus Thiodiazotropha taylori]|uniref:Cytochrome d ubiquinol oxidase subunit II n=1 Tax=Candidatus Thiodiazotropha taylori TaxID=2792791 RepID=A0A9E4N1U1_9GAMM|nr:cytochrome d ubiquinol oxidase subunit II [Candidatus Thiodiazotropha taylori]MCW4255112.1 cytochrome d ubiquinol oxidase subunit II [Candidatus Thiodiazotropha taylori]